MENIKDDSRDVTKNDTFIAIKNITRDGHNYINDAIKNGAKHIICEHGSYSVKTTIVKDTKKYYDKYLYNKYYHHIKDMIFIGITGTNGKTTTCYLIYQMLTLFHQKCVYIGTLGCYLNGEIIELNNTTPNIKTIYSILIRAKKQNCQYIIMEISSQALSLNRIYGLKFDLVAFTNLTKDHLDYHKTISNYLKAKQRLFKLTRNKRIAIINNDDSYHQHFINKNNYNITISNKNGDLVFNNTIVTNTKTYFSFKYRGQNYYTSINLIGTYNIYNYLTSLLLVNSLGFTISNILKLNNKLKPPIGRMELIKYGSNNIYVDYAHTPNAVINVLDTSRNIKKGRIITVVGCGGNRDKQKRPLTGHITEEYSDYVIYTNDNPRYEKKEIIMQDILQGVTKNNHEIIYNRTHAIQKGISMLRNNDILMILGKGHEHYQIIGNKKIPYSDQEVVNKYINN